MSARIDLDRFRSVYSAAVADVLPFLGREKLTGLARHNPGWGPDRHDVGGYLRASVTRYAMALELFAKAGGTLHELRVLDIGGFMGALPLTLARMGARTTLTERYDYYDGAFDDLRGYLVDAGVEIWDLDLTGPVDLPEPRQFGLVTNMALLEHLAHSPRPVMENTAVALAPGGRVLVEVPNLAYWPKRVSLLAGRTVHPPLPDVYAAQEPFTGHHREYTRHDLEQLFELSGFVLDRMATFNYTEPDVPPRGPLWLMDLPRRVVPSAREVLLACGHVGPALADGSVRLAPSR